MLNLMYVLFTLEKDQNRFPKQNGETATLSLSLLLPKGKYMTSCKKVKPDFKTTKFNGWGKTSVLFKAEIKISYCFMRIVCLVKISLEL